MLTTASIFAATLVGVARCQVAPDRSVGVLPSLFVHGDHFSVGQQMGYHTREAIQHRLDNSDSIRSVLQWVEETAEGAAAYKAMLASAFDAFPEYVRELEGMALGSGQSFQTMFVLNVRSELGVFKKASSNISAHALKEEVEHCSDYLLLQTDSATGETVEIVLGHNEDGGAEDRSISTLVTAHVEGPGVAESIRFSAFVYPGDLPSDAFFWNQHGIVGSFNGLYPAECLYGGLGRNFVSRHVLAANSLDEAVARATQGNQATGHSYNLASLSEGRLLNVEQAPGVNSPAPEHASPFVVTPITAGFGYNATATAGALFHANSYLFLEGVPTTESDSSAHRIARAAALPPPESARDVCRVLGDAADEEWPIYRTASSAAQDDGYTLATAVFTLRPGRKPSGSASIYMSNPKTNAEVRFTFDSLDIQ
jgi:hypothetical protein